MIKLALVDDHHAVRESIACFLDMSPSVRVMLQAGDGREFLDKLPSVELDIVLLDLQMPVMDGYETAQILQHDYPDLRILVFSQFTDSFHIGRALRLGVHGYISKSASMEELQQAIIRLQENGFYFQNQLAPFISRIKDIAAKPDFINDEPIRISEREKDIILLAAKGLSGKEIASHLKISLRTVEVHKRNLMDRTHSKNFISVLFYAILHDIILASDIENE